MAALKYSRQREEIKKYLEGRRDHPTAEQIYQDLRRNDPKLSMGTVYRNLSLLVDLGEISRVTVGEGPDHFDGRTQRHGHFICRRCQKVTDVYLEGTESLLKEAADLQDRVVDEIIIHLYGLCRECASDGK